MQPNATGAGEGRNKAARSTPRSQVQRKAESERLLLRAARRLFARQGYLRTTVNQVGEEAGYTGPLVNARFGSKEGLLRAVVKRLAGSFRNDQLDPVLDEASATATMNNYIETYLLEITKRESHIRALYSIMGESISAVPEIRGEVAALSRDLRRNVCQLIERGIADGDFRADLDPAEAATMIVGILRGITMQALLDPREVKVARLVRPVQEQVMLGLTASR
ncbi:MAG: TetR family transcriptional regulator [Pseudomonadota bacterium]